MTNKFDLVKLWVFDERYLKVYCGESDGQHDIRLSKTGVLVKFCKDSPQTKEMLRVRWEDVPAVLDALENVVSVLKKDFPQHKTNPYPDVEKWEFTEEDKINWRKKFE